MEFHPIAEIFPMLPANELETLAADIKANGLLEPITVYEDQILDGRNRYAACVIAGVTPIFVPLNKIDATAFVIAKNLKRRHLTREQRDEVICKLRGQGMTMSKIANSMGVGLGTVERAISDLPIGKSEIQNERGQIRPTHYAPRQIEGDDSGDDDYIPRPMHVTAFDEHGSQTSYVIGPDEELQVVKVLPETPQESPNTHLQALFSSETAEWYTPPCIVERVIKVMGTIDLDPCSNNHNAPNIPALQHFTQDDDGLSHEWLGHVYMNPPYGREIADWVNYLCQEWNAGRVTEAIALVPARTDTEWFRQLRAFPRCFIWGRLHFSDQDTGAPFPSMAVYLGQNPEKFIDAFQDKGDVYQWIQRTRNIVFPND